MGKRTTAWWPWAGVGLGLAAGLGTALRPRPEWDLNGQVAVVTGGSRGLGLLLARELGRQGCQLAICARDEAELSRARADLEARGMTAHAVRCNVADRMDVERFVAEVIHRFGGIDLLVNNAGTIKVGPVTTTKPMVAAISTSSPIAGSVRIGGGALEASTTGAGCRCGGRGGSSFFISPATSLTVSWTFSIDPPRRNTRMSATFARMLWR